MSSKVDIAIIGASCRFPGGANNLDSFWENLKEGRDSVSRRAGERFAEERFFHPDGRIPGRSFTFAAGWLDAGGQAFDADFFGISPREAEYVDPQQRLLLELAWEAFEDSGIPPSEARGTKAGVFTAAGNFDISLVTADDPCLMSSFTMLGMSQAVMANRISHLFDLRGPSVTIDTACSSSLVALHQACQAIKNDRLPLALVGGANILWSPLPFVGFSKAGMLSPDGLCRPFAAGGNGFVRGEGGGMVLLKPLREALREECRIHAVIRATGINTNGRNAGIAIPDEQLQRGLLESVYRSARLDVSRLLYLEAHGTGTQVGDPIEARAIGKAFPSHRRGRLWIGSVKSNLGHLEMASGMPGLLKAILVLKHRLIPQSLHFDAPHPDIDFAGMNLAVPTALEPLPRADGPALAGVNSFGFGGSNAHAVLEEAPVPRSGKKAKARNAGGFLAISAKSRESLDQLAHRYADLFQRHPDTPMEEIASAAIRAREAFPHRLIVSGSSRKSLTAKLRAGAADILIGKKDRLLGEAGKETRRTAFMFSGNGGIWPDMGRDLLRSNKPFARVVGKLDGIMAPILGWSPAEALADTISAERLDKIEMAQPLLLAMQIGLVEALADRGVAPDLVYGHSFGEIPAAWTAGAISLREAAFLACNRSVLQAGMRDQGCMAVLGVSEETAAKWIADIDPGLEIVGVNAPQSVSLVGKEPLFAKIRARAKKERRFFAMLNIPYPFHSRLMAGLREPFLASLPRLKPGKTRLPFISTVTGAVLAGEALDAEYWWNNIAQPVRFLAATETAIAEGARLFLEVGPNRTLDLYIRETGRAHSLDVRALPSLLKGVSTCDSLEAAWKTAWVNGWPLDWDKLTPGPSRRIDLP
ncbi:MAG: type I polyketide synthase, partial [Planctomycetes bacterium]|nr:type I polyketide synthase [Planctomycetota bacterium]